jgi:hypothetical protein
MQEAQQQSSEHNFCFWNLILETQVHYCIFANGNVTMYVEQKLKFFSNFSLTIYK